MTFQRFAEILTLNARRNGSQLRRDSFLAADLLAEAHSEGIRPTVALIAEWNCGETDSWLAGEALAEEHVQKLKRGRGRFAVQNRLAA